uniref:Uncharacterized protein n=1 Tax=Timspurckia oligopyrenoides TaxID=708627 RepID=A0A7S1ETQ9_9RHOD|mmetsp:Transcript_6593/g.11773  ORF Transcript_6593/g.11773 Transcript_6593/m.11773 type:complete len:230 (+) Transcript_6593:122-811(+)|eukprot:CAMPEP_0182449564 /NCGR_PEP_ID=MMETSP1172-20130603/35263_1 /TAXON_ID=708627 /ORGANISM="Timspurckia oligopyrenoides, Strain CCMP3278" /LENGTH=229 /DNA_ID=CAMNT_0024646885 /DNA_START=98 /DNA_END=787 /DNA_ORIENTATION=+
MSEEDRKGYVYDYISDLPNGTTRDGSSSRRKRTAGESFLEKESSLGSSSIQRISVANLLNDMDNNSPEKQEELLQQFQQEQQQLQEQQQQHQVGGRPQVRSEDGSASVPLETPPTARRKLNASSWTVQEDDFLMELVEKYGTVSWHELSRKYFKGLRTGPQLRSRYVEVLNPNRARAPWTPEEDAKLMELQRTIGNRWSSMSEQIQQRTPNDIKNRYRFLSKRKNRSEE